MSLLSTVMVADDSVVEVGCALSAQPASEASVKVTAKEKIKNLII